MTKEWQVRSVDKSGDRVHVELQQADTGPVGLIAAVLATAVVAVVAWSFIAGGILQPAQERNQIWSAAPGQVLVCGDEGTRTVTFFRIEPGTWMVAQRESHGHEQYYPVQVQLTESGAYARGQDVVFVYDAAEREVYGQGRGTWSDCRVTRAG